MDTIPRRTRTTSNASQRGTPGRLSRIDRGTSSQSGSSTPIGKLKNMIDGNMDESNIEKEAKKIGEMLKRQHPDHEQMIEDAFNKLDAHCKKIIDNINTSLPKKEKVELIRDHLNQVEEQILDQI